jgi:hypothetical protein
MPRRGEFNSARQASGRKTAKNKDRGGGGKFTKVRVSLPKVLEAVDERHWWTKEGKFSKCEAKLMPSSEMRDTPAEQEAIPADMNSCGINLATSLEQYDLDDSPCYFCLSDEQYKRTHYTLCSTCRSSSDPTQGWWGATMTEAIPTTGVNHDASSDDEDVFYSEGSGLQDALTGPEVSALLISNGSRMKPAKRGRGFVSVDNHTGFSKSEPKAVRLRVDALRNKDNRIRAKCIARNGNPTTKIPIRRLFTTILTVQFSKGWRKFYEKWRTT